MGVYVLELSHWLTKVDQIMLVLCSSVGDANEYERESKTDV